MVFTTAKEGHKNVFSTLLLTGQEIVMTENQHPSIYSKSVVELLPRAVRNNHVPLSTTEAEYITLASTAQEAVWMRQLTTELESSFEQPQSFMKISSQLHISMTKSPQYNIMVRLNIHQVSF